MVTDVYGSRSVKRRRRTQAELGEVDQAIITAVEAESPVTLRGVYYRVSSAGAVAKTEQDYKLVGRQLVKLRRAGRVGYSKITDGTRYVIQPRTYDNAADAIFSTAAVYRRNLWESQDAEVHLFTEKDAICGVIDRVTREWNVPLGVVRGYCSESFAHEMAEAIRGAGKPVYVYQLGDHDPSGVDAWQDLQKKVRRFAPAAEVHFERIAVTPEQITGLDLPTRPTKKTDTRAKSFTGESVEVDAIPAPTLRALVREAIEQHVDQHQLDVLQTVEAEEQRDLLALAREWGWSA